MREGYGEPCDVTSLSLIINNELHRINTSVSTTNPSKWARLLLGPKTCRRGDETGLIPSR